MLCEALKTNSSLTELKMGSRKERNNSVMYDNSQINRE